MKKLILTLTILFSISINAQYAIISAVDIKEGADEGYLKLEEFFGPIHDATCLLYTSPSPRDRISSRMPSSA